MPKLIIIRGIPGTGKSTLAKQMLHAGEADAHYEADMYFIKDGVYKFDANKIKYAHEWCFETARHALLTYEEDVIVSNTFTQKWEAQRYIDMAKANGIEVIIRTLTMEFGSVHNVPEESINKMRERFVMDTSDWI